MALLCFHQPARLPAAHPPACLLAARPPASRPALERHTHCTLCPPHPQVIAFLAHLRSKGVWGPHLVIGPLSVLPNWVNEIKRWCPSMPVCLYHGTREERRIIRETQLPPGEPRGGLRGGGSEGGGGRVGNLCLTTKAHSEDRLVIC